jgi:hypothetical protein
LLVLAILRDSKKALTMVSPMPVGKSNQCPIAATSQRVRVPLASTISGIVLAAALSSSAAGAGVNFSGHVSRNASAVLSPLSAQALTFTDSAALRLRSANSNGEKVRLALKAYDAEANPVAMEIWSGESILGPGEATMTTVVLPIGSASSAHFTICIEQMSVSGSRIAKACGRYTVKRKSLTN